MARDRDETMDTAAPKRASGSTAKRARTGDAAEQAQSNDGGMRDGASADGAQRQDAGLDEEIRRRAYDRWLARGGGVGSEVDDWCAAENEVRAMRARSGDEGHGEMS